MDNSKPIDEKFSELEEKLKETNKIFEELKKDRLDGNSKKNQKMFEELKKENREILEELKQKQRDYSELESKYSEVLAKYREAKQEGVILSDIANSDELEVDGIKKEKEKLQSDLSRASTESKEAKMEKILLEEWVEIEKKEKNAAQKKYYKAIIVAAVAVAVIFGVYSYMFAELAGQQYRVQDLGEMNSSFVIQNLKGDTIDTWLSWRVGPGEALTVKIVNAEAYPPEISQAVIDALQSETVINIDNSLTGKGERGSSSEYYMGWKGALAAASQNGTQVAIPVNFEIIESESQEADITITLVDEVNADGITGWTVSIADDEINQILKTKVTIFNVSELSDKQVAAIARHEMGHVFGISHSSDTADLMYPSIYTEFPYISECDISAIQSLYDGSQSNQVICEK